MVRIDLDHSVRGKLIPFQSTYFRCTYTEKDNTGIERLYSIRLTKGRIYPILDWIESTYSPSYRFKDDEGKVWEWVDFWGVEDVSFEENLKKILE